jgi:uracil-DNA glycosylase
MSALEVLRAAQSALAFQSELAGPVLPGPLHVSSPPQNLRRNGDAAAVPNGDSDSPYVRIERLIPPQHPLREMHSLEEVVDWVKRTCLVEIDRRRAHAVPGVGNPHADLMIVGEAPGAEEDRQGLPFVGRAGQYLNTLLAEIGLRREDVWIGNVLRCRPPGNRDPQPVEIESCEPWLEKQVELIQPRVVATLGNFATKLLTGSPRGITKVRGTPQVHELGGRSVFIFPILHPAAALRNPAQQPTMSQDFAALRELLDQPVPELVPEPAARGRPVAESAAPAESQLGLFG